MKRIMILLMLLTSLSVTAQPARFNNSSNSALQPSTLSADYHLRHHEIQQPGQKEISSNIYDTIDRYIMEKNFELRDREHYRIDKPFIYQAPQNSIDNENQRINNNGNGNLNNTNSYRP